MKSALEKMLDALRLGDSVTFNALRAANSGLKIITHPVDGKFLEIADRDLSGFDLKGMRLIAVLFVKVDFHSVSLERVDCTECIFTDCRFTGNETRKLILRECLFRGCRFLKVTFTRIDAQGSTFTDETVFEDCHFFGFAASQVMWGAVRISPEEELLKLRALVTRGIKGPKRTKKS
jgi:uncharacterized protein YjbI with pentapeptide repeats